jgi:Mycoplasma protein of unknown function, DUF285
MSHLGTCHGLLPLSTHLVVATNSTQTFPAGTRALHETWKKCLTRQRRSHPIFHPGTRGTWRIPFVWYVMGKTNALDRGRIADDCRLCLKFFEADSFNVDLSDWDVSRLQSSAEMFLQASSYNQSLCSWRERFNTDVDVTSMFQGTMCWYAGDPSTDPSSAAPFCGLCKREQARSLSTP